MNFATYPSIKGRVVFISGGASGIGADIVRAFAGNQALVAFVDVNADAGRELEADLVSRGQRALFLKVDVTDIAALRASIAETRSRLGPVAVLVNNAANDERHEFSEIDVDYWDRAQNVNLRHHFFAAQAVHPHMRELGHGAIINLASIAWRFGGEGFPAYAAAKAAIVGLTRSLARRLGPDNIRVNAIEPGAVMTERQRQLWYTSQESVDAVVQRQALKQTLLGEEIARAALFLAADDSRMITKQSLIVDAGLR
jgi:NAD(P)-dependent dehydrogenase (short-subunit alcohol dehydrogenase family)